MCLMRASLHASGIFELYDQSIGVFFLFFANIEKSLPFKENKL